MGKGIHSYLSYLRDRLLLSRELLTESGSVFVQIGDENVHRVGLVLDEVFGAENRVATISFATTSGSSASHLPQVADYILWYAKDRKQLKYHQLYEPLTRAEIVTYFSWHAMIELPSGECRKPTDKERFDPKKNLPKHARIYRRENLSSQGISTTGRSEPYEWNGRTFHCSPNGHWSIAKEGLDILAEKGRLEALAGQNSLMWKKYEKEVPGRRIHNIWHSQMSSSAKKYVVETSTKVIQRCILMTTDPGDLVFDPTCGSGTTAFVAEQWGRRWITCDTSRVALILARQRLMTSVFDYYQLAYQQEGIGSGLSYKTVPKVSPSTLAEESTPLPISLYDQPLIDKQKKRVSGPFTVEAVPAPAVQSVEEVLGEVGRPADASIARTGETARQAQWLEELRATGIRGKSGQHTRFSQLESYPGRYLHAAGEVSPSDVTAASVHDATSSYAPQRIVICFGPAYAPLEQRQVEQAIKEAQTLVPKPQFVAFAAFQFDPEAAKDIDETQWPDTTLIKVQMNADLLTEDLKKQRTSNESFWLIGQPDIWLNPIASGKDKGKWRAGIRGFDYYNIATGDIQSGDAEQIAIWLLDTDYDGRSLYPRQVFFPQAGGTDGWERLSQSLKAEIDEELITAYQGTESLPFELGDHKRIAVKIVDNRGIESLRVLVPNDG